MVVNAKIGTLPTSVHKVPTSQMATTRVGRSPAPSAQRANGRHPPVPDQTEPQRRYSWIPAECLPLVRCVRYQLYPPLYQYSHALHNPPSIKSITPHLSASRPADPMQTRGDLFPLSCRPSASSFRSPSRSRAHLLGTLLFFFLPQCYPGVAACPCRR